MRSKRMPLKPKGKGRSPRNILSAWVSLELLDSSAVELFRGLPPTQSVIKTFNNVIPHQRKLCKPSQRKHLDPAQIPPI